MSVTQTGSPLRIVHVLTRFLRAGAEENTVATCRHQIESGHQVFLLHGDQFDADYAGELDPAIVRIAVPELVHPIRPWQDIRGVRALRAAYRRIAPDIVHTHQSKAGVLGRLAAIGEPLAVVHTVHIAHFMHVGWLRERVFVALERYCSRHTQQTISVSAGVRQACLERGIGNGDSHTVIHSGMEIQRFQNARPPQDWQTLIGPWPRQRRPFIVLMMAAFEPRKRQEPLLRAIAPLLRREPDLCLVLCGQGVRQAPAEALAEQLGIRESVCFSGYITDPAQHVALADLCILTSEREGLPRVLVQYVAAGKPVLTTHLPGVEAIVQDGVTGQILPNDDIDGLVDTIGSLMHDPARLASMAAEAAAMDISSWNVEHMGERIEAVYRQAIEAASGRPVAPPAEDSTRAPARSPETRAAPLPQPEARTQSSQRPVTESIE